MYKFAFILVYIAILPLLSRGHSEYSGIYPHLAYFNEEGECGTGAAYLEAGRHG